MSITNIEAPPVTFTDNAIQHLKKQLLKQKEPSFIRLTVKTAGCSGLKYHLDFVDHTESTDTVYDAGANLPIYIDKKALAFIQGTVVDYVKQGLNARFQYTNPQEKGSCGCGESFYVE
ncbi:MAG: iron-sulfur cluster assembly accessory protein [Legionellales bacterium]|nr:iron-sulfur cluster assembly accessory protein [Legionellales bacterium]